MAAAASESPHCVLIEQLKPLLEVTDIISEKSWTKINSFIEDNYGDFLTVTALQEAGRQSAAEKIKILEKDLSISQNTTKEILAVTKTNQKSITDLEKLLEAAREDANRSLQNLSRVENELDKMRYTRDTAINERDSLAFTLQKVNNEIVSLKKENETLSLQLKEQIEAKCSTVLEKNALESAQMEAQDRQRQAEQARLLLERQFNNVNEELNNANENLQLLRSQCNTRILEVETELSKKNEIINDSTDEIAKLNEKNEQLTTKAENLTKKILELRKQQAKICENFNKETYGKSKLINIYKTVQGDSESKTDELMIAVEQLQKLLSDASDQCGDLETSKNQMEVKHEQILEDKNKEIASLKTDLDTVNEVLKCMYSEDMDEYTSDLAPSATAVSKLLKSGMSLTQVYSQLVQTMDELSQEKNVNRELNNTIAEIVGEIEARAPKLKQLQEEHNQVIESNAAMTVQLDVLVAECNQLRHESSEANKIANHYTRENNNMKSEIDQLSRQVCFLLKEIEIIKGSSVLRDRNSPKTSKLTSSLDSSSYNIISDSLVTFSGIQELQENNRKLLHMVRELTTKQEEAERNSNLINNDELQQKLQNYMLRVNELTEAQERQTKMMSELIHQRDMYKKICDSGQKNQEINSLHTNSNSLNNSASSKKDTSSENRDKSTELGKLQSQLQNAEKQLTDFKEEHKTYKEEKNTNERLLIEKIDKMQKQISDLSVENGKSLSLQEYNKEKINMLQANTVTYKKQIAALEEINKTYSVTIAKQENLLKQIREETMTAQRNASEAEVALEKAQHECKLLTVAKSTLKAECDLYLRERHKYSLLSSNLELIKTSVQRANRETFEKNETILNGTLRECTALRSRLQIIQNENLEIQKQLQAKYDAALKCQEIEKNISVQLRKELNDLRNKTDDKTNSIDGVTSKLQASPQSFSLEDTAEALNEVANLESQLSLKSAEIKSLTKQVFSLSEHIKQYRDLSEFTEKELKALHDKFSVYKENTEKQLAALKQNETHFKEKCSELEAELSLQSNDQNSKELDLISQLADVRNKLEITLKDLEKKTLDLTEATDKASKLSIIAQNAEEKYTEKLKLHSSDIQILNGMKAQLINLNSEIVELTTLKDQALEKLEENKKVWETKEKLLLSEKDEIAAKQSDLIQLNSDILDQIETFNAQLTISHVTKHSNSMNESVGDISINQSMNEEENKTSVQLLRIIKYLRKEKDLTVAKFDILQAENNRMQSEFQIISKKFDEAKLALTQEREKNNMNKGAAAKQSELIRKVETLNALMDSNRSLRETRDSLTIQVQNLTNATKKLEEQISPLQEKNRELSVKVEALQTESKSFQNEAERWRTQCKALLERANKTSPEDWKRLQNERESLIKTLSVEQEHVKRLTDELTSARIQKSQLEEQLLNAKKQVATSNEDIKRLTDDLNTVKQEIGKISQELNNSKASLTRITAEKSKIINDLSLKGRDLNDIRNKEMQIRKIAKKYKAQFEELTETMEENKKKSDCDTVLKNALEAELKSVRETNEKLKQDLEKLRSDHQDKEEKAKSVLKQASNKISQLTEAKTQLASQFTEAQKKIESFVQIRDEHDVRLSILKSQYEGRLARLEKEKIESLAERTKEIEALQQKVLLLQLVSQPGTKQPAAEKAASDPPTANIKPMAGISQQTTTRGRAGDPTLPLASVRPTAAVLPSSPATTSVQSPTPHTMEYMPTSSSRPLHNVSTDGVIASTVTQEVVVPQQAVALVMPRVEGGSSSEATSAQHALSSDSVAPPGPVARIKRPRAPGVTPVQSTPKRTRLGGFERSLEVEYQVPTSSRCDHEYYGSILVDSEEDEDNRCTGTDTYQTEEAEDEDGSEVDDDVDDEAEEDSEVDDDADPEKDDEDDAEMGSSEEVGEGDNEVDDTRETMEGVVSNAAIASSEISEQELPAQSSVDESPVSDATATIALGRSGDATASGAATPRRTIPDAPPVASVTGYDDHDDGIVPSTPTLYVPKRNDGFGEAVSSPGADVGTSTTTATGRFTFATPALDDTHADLAAQLPHHGDIPSIVVSQAETNESEANGDAILRDDQVNSEASLEDDASAVSSQGNQPTLQRQSSPLEEGREAEASGEVSALESPSTPGGTVRRGIRGTRRPFRAAHHNRPTSFFAWRHQDRSQHSARGAQRPKRPFQHF